MHFYPFNGDFKEDFVKWNAMDKQQNIVQA